MISRRRNKSIRRRNSRLITKRSRRKITKKSRRKITKKSRRNIHGGFFFKKKIKRFLCDKYCQENPNQRKCRFLGCGDFYKQESVLAHPAPAAPLLSPPPGARIPALYKVQPGDKDFCMIGGYQGSIDCKSDMNYRDCPTFCSKFLYPDRGVVDFSTHLKIKENKEREKREKEVKERKQEKKMWETDDGAWAIESWSPAAAVRRLPPWYLRRA